MTMEMINVLKLMAEGKIKEGTKLEFDCYEYEFSEDHFEDNVGFLLEDVHEISTSFLNMEVDLIPPKPKKYLVKINIRGLQDRFTYLNYDKNSEHVHLHDKYDHGIYKTQFTKQELRSIQPAREFIEDMKGKYELIEVEE